MSDPKTYRKKPVEVEAMQWADEEDAWSILEWAASVDYDEETAGPLRPGSGDDWGLMTINTLEGAMAVTPLDFIIKGVNGEFYPCKPDIFWKTYEEVSA
ncbi:MAG: hypothetical protein RR905_02795 [Aurantimicrobium sp.]